MRSAIETWWEGRGDATNQVRLVGAIPLFSDIFRAQCVVGLGFRTEVDGGDVCHVRGETCIPKNLEIVTWTLNRHRGDSPPKRWQSPLRRWFFSTLAMT